MANDPKQPNSGTPPMSPMPGAKQPQLRVLGQYIKDLSFESPSAPKSLREPGGNPNIQVEVNVGNSQLENNIFECGVELKVKATTPAMTIYNVELLYAGAFELQNFPAELVHPVLFVNCPAILFPFVRRLIGDLTREGGFPPLWLDPIDFGALYNQRMAQMQAQAQAAGQGGAGGPGPSAAG
jgi:preprotein translocase subunit SecB